MKCIMDIDIEGVRFIRNEDQHFTDKKRLINHQSVRFRTKFDKPFQISYVSKDMLKKFLLKKKLESNATPAIKTI